MMANMFAAHWDASGSSLCLGHLEIGYLEQTLGMDPERKENDMGTYAIYSLFFGYPQSVVD